MGCNDVIMLITDGAPSNFKEVAREKKNIRNLEELQIFELYNKEKRVCGASVCRTLDIWSSL